MKKTCLLVLSFALLATMMAPPATAQDKESPWSFSLDTTFVSQYLWRGFVVNSSPSMQPNVSVGYKGFSISSWSNISQKIEGWGQNWVEHDFTADYSHSFDKLGVSVGYIWYHFPGIPSSAPGRHSHEFYAGVSYDTFLQPSFTFYRDFDQGDGNYFYLSGGHSFELPKGVAFNLGAGAGLNNKQWIDITTISNFDATASFDIPWGKVVFSPFFTQMVGHKSLFGSNNMFGVNLSVISF